MKNLLLIFASTCIGIIITFGLLIILNVILKVAFAVAFITTAAVITAMLYFVMRLWRKTGL